MSTAVEVIARCRELAAISDTADGTTRTFLSDGMRRANDLVAAWMADAGLAVQTDAAGNLRGRSSATKAKTLVMASHLDTVPNAGAYDGALGVVMGVAVAELLRRDALPFELEVIAFSEEEGVRFGAPFIGSRAVVGALDDALLSRTDRNGVSVREAIRGYGLTEKPEHAKLQDAFGYLEFHIEQGPELDHEGLPLGVVESIAGQSRYSLTFTGESNHAGTTPMRLRHDAMAAAAEWMVEVESYARATPGLVATVGSVKTLPGAGNVIAGEVRASLDVRSALDASRMDACDHLLAEAVRCASSRGVQLTSTQSMNQSAVPMDRHLLHLLEDAVATTGVPIRRMVSGAGHDAMIVAPHIPSAMLFLRSPGGLSHHPDESVRTADVQLGLDAGVAFVRALAQQETQA